MDEKLWKQAESYLGTNIRQSEWDDAKDYAERKLACIIEREGDLGEARRESSYLAKIIAETVGARRLSEFTRQNYLMHKGIKKGQHTSENACHPYEQPYCITNTAKMQ